MIGIKNCYNLTANQVFTSNATLAVLTGFSQNVAALQTVHFRGRLIFSTGATGGIRLQIVGPSGLTSFVNSIQLNDAVTPAVTPAVQTSSAAYTNALAVAGNHFLDFEGTVVIGATAGTLQLQVAQNTSTANSLTFLAGCFMETTVL